MVTLTFTGTPAEIHHDMRDMLNLTKGAAATLPGNFPEVGEDRVARVESKITPDKQDALTLAAATAPRLGETFDKPADPVAQPEKKTRTRRTKEQIAADKAAASGSSASQGDVFSEPVSNGAAAPAKSDAVQPATANVSAPIVNKEAVHQALQQVNVAVGLPKAREILSEFKVNRISEIKEDQFKAFIEKCNAAVMMA